MSHFRRVAAVLTVVSVSALLTLIVWKPVLSHVRAGLTSAEVPTQVAGYVSTGDYEQSQAVKDALPGATLLSRGYRSDGDDIDFTMVSGTGRSAVHDPRLCLTGSGWQLSDDHTERVPGTPLTLHVCQATTKPGPPDAMVAYFYVVNGRIISSPTEIRAALLWSGLLGRQNSPVYFFRFLQPLGADDAANQQNHARLQAFVAQMWRATGPKVTGEASTAKTADAAAPAISPRA